MAEHPPARGRKATAIAAPAACPAQAAAAVGAVAAADVESEPANQSIIIMKTSIIAILVVASSLALPSPAQDAAPIPPKIFETPVDASDAFITAAKNGTQQAILEIFGDKHKDLIGTADPERDRELRAKVAAMAVERRRFRENGENSVTMVIGAEAWPFPIPIVKTDKGWQFDTDTGIDEIIKRRIGENEITVINAMRAYPDAQRQYAAVPRDGGKVRQFARKFQSSPGKQDGLHWTADIGKGEEASPAGPEIKDPETSHAGYHFKILTAQGEAAPAGKFDYIINGHFIGGFALIAWPAEYGRTGVMTFIVNHYGDVYERDLGPETSKLAAEMTEYNPGEGWNETSE
jgi:hypothetical protein